jgi:lipid-binding SYLF domain-containing protein
VTGDGFYTEDESPVSPTSKPKVLKKIPQRLIQNAVGLAIFTTMRAGLWISGAGGSGVLVARKEDGSWSPPSSILLYTPQLRFLAGVDIYDCVIVINTRDALHAFTKFKTTLDGENSAVAGPVGMGGILEHDWRCKQANKPLFTYLKSRGVYASVQMDGSIVVERTDENDRFYGQTVSASDILAGKVRRRPYGVKMLMETIKAAEGREDFDRGMINELAAQPAPGDVSLELPTQPRRESSGSLFGIPEPEDPDPFGFLALQRAGMEIREAGTKSRPSSTQFEYRPSPTSPVYTMFHRLSIDTFRTSNRGSCMSNRTRTSTDRTTQTAEIGTQTDVDELVTPATSPSISNFDRNTIDEEAVKPREEIDYAKIVLGPYSSFDHSGGLDFSESETTAMGANHGHDSASQVCPRDLSLPESDAETNYDTDEGYDGHDEDEPVVFEIAARQQTGSAIIMPKINLVKAKGSLVDIPKRVTPVLPARSPMRANKIANQVSGRYSKDGFEEEPLGKQSRGTSEFDLRLGGRVPNSLDNIVTTNNGAGQGMDQIIKEDMSGSTHPTVGNVLEE